MFSILKQPILSVQCGRIFDVVTWLPTPIRCSVFARREYDGPGGGPRMTSLRILTSVLSAFCLATTSAYAGNDWNYGIERPPVLYASMTPNVPVIEYPVPRREVDSTCRTFAKDRFSPRASACALKFSYMCIVVFPSDIEAGKRAALLEHEINGHCNGLTHDRFGRNWYLNGEKIDDDAGVRITSREDEVSPTTVRQVGLYVIRPILYVIRPIWTNGLWN